MESGDARETAAMTKTEINGTAKVETEGADGGDQPVEKSATQLKKEAKKKDKLEKFQAKKEKPVAPPQPKVEEKSVKVKKEENEDDFQLDPSYTVGKISDLLLNIAVRTKVIIIFWFVLYYNCTRKLAL